MVATVVTADAHRDVSVEECVQFASTLARRLIDRLAVVDFKSYEPLSPGAAVGFMLPGAAQQVQQSMTEAIRLLISLPNLILGELESGDEPDDAMELTVAWDLGEQDAIEGIPEPAHDRLVEDIDDALARLTAPAAHEHALDPGAAVAVWQMLAHQLRQARDRLKMARRRRSKWGMITEGEEGRRKTQKALQYALTIALRLVASEPVTQPFGDTATELECALMVRGILLAFSRDVLAITDDTDVVPDAELGIKLRDLRIRFLDLFLSAQYRELRAPDRYQLQGLRRRLDAWLDGVWDACDVARQLLADVRAYAELLVLINNREILIEHDRRVRERGLTDLSDLAATLSVSTRNGWGRLFAILQDLQPLSWRDLEFGRWWAAELEQGAARRADIQTRVEKAAERLRQVSVP